MGAQNLYSDYYSTEQARVNPYVLRFINDIHDGSKYCDFNNVRPRLIAIQPDGKTYLNGDITDLSCCPTNEVKALRAYQDTVKNKWGKFYIRGNHDLLPFGNEYAVHTLPNDDRILITHGHLVGDAKRKKKWLTYEQKEAGASKWKLKWVDFADDMDWLKGVVNQPKEDVVADAIRWAKGLGCKYVVMGHFHPLKRIDIIKSNVHLIFLPKGFNEVEFAA